MAQAANLGIILTSMRKATLLYNARSGGRRKQREDDLQGALKILNEAGVAATLIRTQSSVDASEQARQAIAAGSDTIFACGGDGTVHDVLQGIVGSHAALGVIPMGTANALAHDLRIPADPASAIRAALEGETRRVAVGQVTVRGFDNKPSTRYFTVAVGVGVDAHLFYRLNASVKQRIGMAAYYLTAWHLWFTHRMGRFRVDWTASEAKTRHGATQLLAVRIGNFGGVLRELAPGASLYREDLRLVVCHTDSRIAYLNYVARSFFRGGWPVPGVSLHNSKAVTCDYEPFTPSNGSKVYVEADGELIGSLPAKIEIVPDALTLVIPKSLPR
jgi:diacylglycerol kinase (ATP)